MVEEDNALMDELSVDIAAAMTLAIIIPRTPTGRWLVIKKVNSRVYHDPKNIDLDQPNIPVIKTAIIASFEKITLEISSTIKLAIKDNNAEIQQDKKRKITI